MIIVGSFPMEAACPKRNNERAVEMPKKFTALYLPNSDGDALVIAGECFPASNAVASPGNIVRSALIEGRNHEIASAIQLHDHPLKFIIN